MLSPSLAGQFAALTNSVPASGGTFTGPVQFTNIGVGLTPDATRIHMLSQAANTTPTDFSADDFVIGRAALTGASSGALFGRYDSTNSVAFIGALSPAVAWRNLVIGAATTVFQNASGVAKFTTPGTGDNDATLSSAGQYLWSSTADASTTPDTGVARGGAGLVDFTDGSTGNATRVRMALTGAPATASAAGRAGEIAIDTGFIYVCTATNTWKRVAIATW